MVLTVELEMPTMTHPKVLIADADPDLRRQLYTALLTRDVFSDTVADGEAALACIEGRGYAMVLIDVDLPKVDPLRIVERLSSRPDAERPFILLLTSGVIPRTGNLDCVQIVLRKPIDVPAIADVVQSCIRSVTKARARAGARKDARPEDQPRV